FGPGGADTWNASCRLSRDYARSCTAKPIVATHCKADIGEPDRPQAPGRLGQNSDHLFDIGLNAPGRTQLHKERAAIIRDVLRLIDQFPQHGPVYANERNNRSRGCAEDELRCLVGWQSLLRCRIHRARIGMLRTYQVQRDLTCKTSDARATGACPVGY